MTDQHTPSPPDAPPGVFLRAGGDRRLSQGYPWAFSNEVRIDAAAKALPPGSVVVIHRVDGKPLGVGTFNPHALIAFRRFDPDPACTIDHAFLVDRLRRALALRERLFRTPFYRWVHAEADGLPGLVIDRFDSTVVVQANTAGIDALLPGVLGALDDVLGPEAVVLRNDSRARAPEGLEAETSIVHGDVSHPIRVEEGPLRFRVDVLSGQKTGWYFDQRDNRAFVAPLAVGGRVLDAYCHTGGFAVSAAVAGASSVMGVDSSEPALALARQSADDNKVGAICAFERADVFDALERLAAAGERFRLVVADPPAFVKSRKELGAGLKGYRKLTRMAAALIESGGFLFVASCSHNVEPTAFNREVAIGLARAGRTGRIIRAAGAGADHPVHPWLPESTYLKTLTLQLD